MSRPPGRVSGTLTLARLRDLELAERSREGGVAVVLVACALVLGGLHFLIAVGVEWQ